MLKGISLTIHRGEMVALMGASGSGKTTLMNLLGCLDRPSSGEFWLDGQEMSQFTPNQRALVRTAKLGFVFQSFNLLPRTSALHQVIMPLDYSTHRPHANEALRLSHTLLDRVGLAERTDHEPSQMSGGQQQRVAIARSLINRPPLLFADEPTGNLDSHTSEEILRMFQRLNAEGITVILVTHDPKVAPTSAKRVIRLADGLVEGDETRTPGRGQSSMEPSPASGDADGRCRLTATETATSHAATATETAVPARMKSMAMAMEMERGGYFDRRGRGGSRPPEGIVAAATGCCQAWPRAAATAHRSGRIERNARTENNRLPRKCSAAARLALWRYPTAFGRHSTCGSLIPPTWRTALSALRRNKMRSALTALGVIIGVGAVIAMTEIGDGSKAAVQKTIASMGANNLVILPGAAG